MKDVVQVFAFFVEASMAWVCNRYAVIARCLIIPLIHSAQMPRCFAMVVKRYPRRSG
jgi:hypothetical protein